MVKAINPKKGNPEVDKTDSNTESINKSKILEDMTRSEKDLCDYLAEPSVHFIIDEFLNKLSEHKKTYGRLLYVEITNCIAEYSVSKRSTLISNIQSVAEFVYSAEYTNNDENNDIKKTVLKLWDHINLANRQLDIFEITENNMPIVIENRIVDAGKNILKQSTEQLISLIGIFTALSFLVFGGVTSLDNIFAGAQDIPILKLMIVGLIWCFSIMNLVFVFMIFISKMTKLSIKSSENVNDSIVKQYPLICWSNFVIISILSITVWIYFIRKCGYNKSLENLLSKYSIETTIIGLVIILAVIIYVGCKLFSSWTKKE